MNEKLGWFSMQQQSISEIDGIHFEFAGVNRRLCLDLQNGGVLSVLY